MNNALMIFLVFLFSYQLNAETPGIIADFNYSNILEKNDDSSLSSDNSFNPGFHLGIIVDFSINKSLSFETGLIHSKKGVKYESDDFGSLISASLNLHYIDIPILLKSSYELKNGTKLFGVIGPYVGIALSGKAKLNIAIQGKE